MLDGKMVETGCARGRGARGRTCRRAPWTAAGDARWAVGEDRPRRVRCANKAQSRRRPGSSPSHKTCREQKRRADSTRSFNALNHDERVDGLLCSCLLAAGVVIANSVMTP